MADQQRAKFLIEAMIEALDDLRSPFETAFLVEHGVTLDEVGDMSDFLSAGLHMILLGFR